MTQTDVPLQIEVLSRIPNSVYRIFARTAAPVRDVRGFRLLADATLAEAPFPLTNEWSSTEI